MFPSSSNTRQTHNPQPSSQLQVPPDSFVRSGGLSFRSSLKTKTSALFSRDDKAGKAGKGSKDERISIHPNLPTQPSTEVPAHYYSFAPPPQPAAKEKVKTRTKTRKALADILGWGNHSNAPALPPTRAEPPKVTLHTTPSVAPAVPPKELQRKPSVLLKKSRPLSDKPSISELSGSATLRPLQTQTPGTIRRPSIGPDPFGRKLEGAHVIDSAPRHSASIKSVTLARSASISSGKALSAKTVQTDDASGKDFRQ